MEVVREGGRRYVHIVAADGRDGGRVVGVGRNENLIPGARDDAEAFKLNALKQRRRLRNLLAALVKV